MIDREQAALALSDIDGVVRRVRQSRIYNLASLMLIMWGVLVFAGYVLYFLSPRNGAIIWIALDVAGIAGSFAISRYDYAREGIRTFDVRWLSALLLFIAFGIFCCWLGHFTPRQMGAFWPIYFMLVYIIAGLWFGHAFVVIGAVITALTLVGYFLLGTWFELWMAFVDGGGLVLGGLWMRRS